jgi:hypothetical protein
MPSREARNLAIAPFASVIRVGGVGDASLWKSLSGDPQLLLVGEVPSDGRDAILFEVDIHPIGGCEGGPSLCFDFGTGFAEQERVPLRATRLSAKLFSAAIRLSSPPKRVRLDPCAGVGEFLCSEVRVSAVSPDRVAAAGEELSRLPQSADAAGNDRANASAGQAPREELPDSFRIGAILHLFYEDLWPEMAAYLGRIPSLERLYVSIQEGASRDLEGRIAAAFPNVLVRRVPNRGRDVLPFLQWLEAAAHEGIELVCKVHTKRSPHVPTGEAWRRDMLDKLLGSAQAIGDIVSSFHAHPSLGIVGPAGHVVPSSFFWERNAARVEELSLRMGFDVRGVAFSYVAGSMFWARVAALMPLARIRLHDEDFEVETGLVDGTLAHAIERCFPIAARIGGYRVAETEIPAGATPKTVADFAPLPPGVFPPGPAGQS